MVHKAYWWRGNPGAGREIHNWGDRLNWTLLQAMGATPAWREPHSSDLVVIGSVLEHLPAGWTGTVCGAGKLHEDSTVDLSGANVVALRGKLTAAGVRGAGPEVVLGDPALLLPDYIGQWPAKYDLGVVPHWSDDTLARRYPDAHIIDPTARPEQVVAEIIKCRRIISSSLHGIIVADAYGIPRQAELFPNAHREGGDFKFRDYASIYFESGEDIDVHFGQMWRAPHHKVAAVQARLREALAQALGTPTPARLPDPRTPILHKGPPCPQISLLVPFRDDGEHRSRVWRWLRRYWLAHLDSVEIIQGHSASRPFNKSEAVNQAAARARGRVFVILDADAYQDAEAIQYCADAIEAAENTGRRRWFMPYDKLYRLSRDATEALLHTDPTDPFSPVSSGDHEPGSDCDYGHQYGALMQVMSRSAFFHVGGMDPRFARGWGGEDVSLLRALDTLWAPHEVAPYDVVHLWHARPGHDWKTRRWVGQSHGSGNFRLAQRYVHATGEPGWMRSLVDEHVQPQPDNTCQRRRRFCRWPRCAQAWGHCFRRGAGRLIFAMAAVIAVVAGAVTIATQDMPHPTTPTSPPVTSPSVPPPASTVTPAPTTTVPQATPPAAAPFVPTRHTVIRGDTLWGIAVAFSGNGLNFHQLAAFNHIANPDLIHPGQILTIPR